MTKHIIAGILLSATISSKGLSQTENFMTFAYQNGLAINYGTRPTAIDPEDASSLLTEPWGFSIELSYQSFSNPNVMLEEDQDTLSYKTLYGSTGTKYLFPNESSNVSTSRNYLGAHLNLDFHLGASLPLNIFDPIISAGLGPEAAFVGHHPDVFDVAGIGGFLLNIRGDGVGLHKLTLSIGYFWIARQVIFNDGSNYLSLASVPSSLQNDALNAWQLEYGYGTAPAAGEYTESGNQPVFTRAEGLIINSYLKIGILFVI